MSAIPHRAATTLLTLAVPAALLGGTVAVVAAWSDELPDPVAVHFGPDGPNGYASLGAFLWSTVAIAGLVAVGAWALAFFRGRAALVRRTATATAVGIAGLMSALVIGVLHLQLGLTDATGTGSVELVTGTALAVGVLGAVLGAWLMPGDPPQPTSAPVPPDAPRFLFDADDTTTWAGHAQSGAILVVGGAGFVVVLVVTLLLGAWLTTLVAVVLAVVVMSMSRFSVVVDRRGLVVRGVLGVPHVVVPLDEVVRAGAVQISPFADFGGWGYRVGRAGRIGVVVRTGEAIEVERTGGRSFVVTVDDAATAAALLNTLAARSRPA